MKAVSIIIPAWNEERTIAATLQALQSLVEEIGAEIIVVDDGSTDRTAEEAEPLCTRLIRLPLNLGKGRALHSGIEAASGDIFLFLDADLQESAEHAGLLLRPVLEDTADMAVACFAPAKKRGGLGLVKLLARYGIMALSGFRCQAPLSGQRAVRKQVLEKITLSDGFGVEVGLTIDAAALGFRIVEVGIPFRHRLTGNDAAGWMHRGKQFAEVGRTLWSKWRKPVC